MSQVHIVQRLAPGGIEHLVLSLAGKADIHIISLEGQIDELARAWPKLEAFRGRVTALGKSDGSAPGLVGRLARTIARVSPESVVTHHAGPLFYGAAAARIAGVRRLAHVEHDAWHLENARRRGVVRALLRTFRPRRFAVSRMVAEAARNQTGLDFRVLANGVDCERFRPAERDMAREKAGLPAGRRIIGAAGRLETVKGFDLLVEAAVHLPDDVTVIIWGDGSQRPALEARIAELGLGKRVLLPGRAENLHALFPALDLFCLPSRNEGLPLAVLEAQACGIPVVAHDVGGVAEAICPASGRLVQFDPAIDPAASGRRLAAVLALRLEAPSTCNPRPFVEANHSLAATARSYLEL